MRDVVLICGAAGFIGSHAASVFRQQGWRVVGAGRSEPGSIDSYPRDIPYWKGDFEGSDFVTGLFAATSPTRVIFVAGPSDVQQSFIDPVQDFRNQSLPLVRILDAARRMKAPPGVVLLSSAAVYGNPATIPVCEDSSPAPISPYGFHKLLQESLLDEFHQLYGLPVCKARVFSTYGSGLRHLAVWDITKRAMKRDATLRGTGKETRDYLHVRDVGRALERIARHSAFEGEVINVASGTELAMARVAALIHEAMGFGQQAEFDGKELAGSPLRWCADANKLRALGFSPEVTIEAGIPETVNWIKQHA